jgi:hypothetical protein
VAEIGVDGGAGQDLVAGAEDFDAHGGSLAPDERWLRRHVLLPCCAALIWTKIGANRFD